MLGYSDSVKDSGYLAANWALYQAQENIARGCREHDVQLTLFHGRGGSVARGGGPANRAIRAQPPGTINGRFRMTEQGETITSRYANPDLAHRHLEQIVSAVLLASAPTDPAAAIPAAWRATGISGIEAKQIVSIFVYLDRTGLHVSRKLGRIVTCGRVVIQVTIKPRIHALRKPGLVWTPADECFKVPRA